MRKIKSTKGKEGRNHMKKGIILFANFIFLTSVTHAQENKQYAFSVMGSINFFHQKFSCPEEFPIPQHKPALAYSAGLGAEFRLIHRLFLEANVLYKVKKSELVEFSGLNWGDTYYRFQYVALPLLLKYRFPVSRFVVFPILGLETDFLLRSQVKDEKRNLVVEPIESTRFFDLQVVSGLGVSYRRISLTFRYAHGVMNLNTKEESVLMVKNRGFEFIVGFHF
jgi:hypothetical protein